MTRAIKDMAKSVHTRLLFLAKGANRPFNEMLQLYAMERFLYRLSRSKHEKKFVLKGGLMLRVWRAPVTRPTKDLDLLGRPLRLAPVRSLTPAFSESADPQKRWAAFLKKSALSDAPPSFADVVLVIRGCLLRVLQTKPPKRWSRGGPWSGPPAIREVRVDYFVARRSAG